MTVEVVVVTLVGEVTSCFKVNLAMKDWICTTNGSEVECKSMLKFPKSMRDLSLVGGSFSSADSKVAIACVDDGGR